MQRPSSQQIGKPVFYHGGRYPQDGILTPQPLSRSGDPGDGYVYITTDRGLAATYASTLPGSWLMEVVPLGDVEADPGSMLTTSFRCPKARVVRRYQIGREERRQRAASVAATGIYEGITTKIAERIGE